MHFDDALEGTLSPKNREARGYVYSGKDKKRKLYLRLSREFELMKSWTFVSCWRIDEDENIRCWSEYEGRLVAVQTNYLYLSRLAACYFCARVEYVDHRTTWIAEGSSFSPFFHKDKKEYEWEQEFRIIDQPLPEIRVGHETRHDCSTPCRYAGRILRADLTKLAQQIVISPYASAESVAEVRALATEYGCAGRVRQSNMGV